MKPTPDPSIALLDRLKHLGRERGLPAGTMLLLYAQQGFLARLDASAHASRFVLKGGLSLFTRYEAAARPTQDIDLAAQGLENTPQRVADVLLDVLGMPYEDGLRYDPKSLRVQAQNDGFAYRGVGAKFIASVGRSQQPMQLDVSFGNVITPDPVILAFPRLLVTQAARVRVYPLETVIAEKFAALAELGVLTTRMKDVYDLWVISHREPFASDTLRLALRRSFAARETPWEGIALALSDAFGVDARLENRWTAYLKRTGFIAPRSFTEVMLDIRSFLNGVVTGVVQGEWKPDVGHWELPKG